jgi:phytoene synthase
MPSDVTNAYEYCRQVTRRASKTFYWSSLFLPRHKRMAAWAIYAFCRSVDDIADTPEKDTDPIAALDVWRQRLRQVYQGVVTHPIMRAWADMLERYDVPLAPALELIDGVQTDLGAVHFATFDELYRYCYCVAGTVGLLMTPVLGYASAEALPCAVQLGVAMQLTNILRDVGEDAALGRIYLPSDEMARFGYCESELLQNVVNLPFIDLMQFQIARACEYYERARPGIALLDPSVRLAIQASAELYRGILGSIMANGYDVFTQRAYVPLSSKVLMMPKLWLKQRIAGQNQQV